MDARELRIGNWVKEHWDNSRPFKVESIDDLRVNLFATDSGCSYGMHYGIIDSDYDLDNLVGIPLTEEILLKCGLKKHHAAFYCDQFMIKNLTGNEWIVKYYPDKLGSAKGIRGGIRLYFLHQLQNLYFALTGEELNIEL